MNVEDLDHFDDLLTPAETMKALGVKQTKTLAALAASGRLVAVRAVEGAARRYTKQSVRAEMLRRARRAAMR